MTHVAFPFRPGPLGRTEAVADDAYLRMLIEQALFTRPGERVMRPDFGAGAAGLVFEPNGPGLAIATEVAVHATLNAALGALLEVTAVRVEAKEAILSVTVRYAPRDAGPARTATFTRKTG